MEHTIGIPASRTGPFAQRAGTATDADWIRRDELSDLLRACRRRLDRALPEGRGRGLRQADAASLCGLSLRAYTNFERGAGPTPNADLVDKVATALQMNDAERSALHILATQQDPPRPIGRCDDNEHKQPGPSLRLLVDQQGPNPAGLTDETWTLLYFNNAMDAWSGGWYSRNSMPNLVLYLFSQHAEETLPDIHKLRRSSVAAIRYQWTRNPATPRAAELINQLQHSAEAAELWKRHELVIPPHEYGLRIRSNGQVAKAHVAFPSIHPWLWLYTLVLPPGIAPPVAITASRPR